MPKDYRSNWERWFEGAERAAHAHWRVLLIEGMALVLFGGLALLIPPFVSLGIASSVGWILLFGGLAALILQSRLYRASGYRIVLSAAVLSVIAGPVLLLRPLAGVISLTVIIVICFAFAGVTKLTYPLERFPRLASYRRWIWASGVLDLVLAMLIFTGLPENAAWALGLLFATNMILGGVALIAVALHERRTLDQGAQEQTSPRS